MDLELPERYLLGAEPARVCSVHLNGGTKREESTSVRVKHEITGLAGACWSQSTGATLEAARDVGRAAAHGCWRASPVGCTNGCGSGHGAALLRVPHARLKKRRKTAKRRNKA